MIAELCDYIKNRVRYGITDENGDTREDKNQWYIAQGGQLDEPMPDMDAPDLTFYLIEWFDEIRNGFRDVVDGVPVPIPWTEYLAWATATRRIVRPAEYAILQAMHRAWRQAIGPEIEAAREREKANK